MGCSRVNNDGGGDVVSHLMPWHMMGYKKDRIVNGEQFVILVYKKI